MLTHTTQHYRHAALRALVAASVIVALLFLGFFLAEPTVSFSQADTSEFTITQQITDETSFLVAPADVSMTGSINGVTGGQATGTTYFVVESNNSTGYYVEIAYENNGTANAMLGETTADESLRDYDGDVGGEPSFGYTASTAAQFAYTVTSSTTADTDQSFLNDGGNCNAGSTQTADTCWKAPETTAFRIVDRSSAASNGATSTITFNVTVPSGATPTPSAEPYTATATLSLFTQ